MVERHQNEIVSRASNAEPGWPSLLHCPPRWYVIDTYKHARSERSDPINVALTIPQRHTSNLEPAQVQRRQMSCLVLLKSGPTQKSIPIDIREITCLRFDHTRTPTSARYPRECKERSVCDGSSADEIEL